MTSVLRVDYAVYPSIAPTSMFVIVSCMFQLSPSMTGLLSLSGVRVPIEAVAKPSRGNIDAREIP